MVFFSCLLALRHPKYYLSYVLNITNGLFTHSTREVKLS